MCRDVDIDRIAVVVFGLAELNTPIANVLRPQAGGILATATGIEQQIERQARLAADRMPIAILLVLLGSPGVVAVRDVLDLPHTQGLDFGERVPASPRRPKRIAP